MSRAHLTSQAHLGLYSGADLETSVVPPFRTVILQGGDLHSLPALPSRVSGNVWRHFGLSQLEGGVLLASSR